MMFIVVTEIVLSLISFQTTLSKVSLSLLTELMIYNFMMFISIRILNKALEQGSLSYLKYASVFSVYLNNPLAHYTRFDDWCVTELLKADRVDARIDFGMTIVKELIVKFSAESIQDIPKDGAEKAFEKIGLDKCFTVEFQEIAELKRDQLNGNCDALIGEGNDDGIFHFYYIS